MPHLCTGGFTRTLHRASVGKGPSGPEWRATALGFWSGRVDGRLLLAPRRGRFCAERKFLLFDGPGGAMGIGFFLFWRRDLFFARKRGKKLVCFFSFVVVFLLFLVVISRFLGCLKPRQ